jgi:hypothetical protein
MVILIINQNHVLAFDHERQTPVATDCHRPMTFELAVQGMQLPAGSVHVSRRSGIVQGEKLLPEPVAVTRLDLRLRSGAKELLDTFVPEALNHMYSV